jgi:hypothetical protein
MLAIDTEGDVGPSGMGRRDFGRLAIGAVGVAGAARLTEAAQTPGWTRLWNVKDLSGWTTWMQRPEPTSVVPGLARGDNGRYTEAIGSGRDPLNVFTVVPDVDGRPAIRVSGEVFGELRTTRSFENYQLRLQFKWGEKKWPPREGASIQRDSGLLYHVHAAPGAEGRTWARSVELQIQERDVGDLYAIGSAIAVRSKPLRRGNTTDWAYDPAGDWTYFSQRDGSAGRCIKQPDAEKPTGEWNTVEIVCLGPEAIHIVNGTVVMRLHDPRSITTALPTPVTSGAIILQSEGAEIFFRDVEFRPIRAVPAEYRG